MTSYDKLLNKTLLHSHNGRDVRGGHIGSVVPVSSVIFDTLYTPTGTEPVGFLFWNEVDGTIDIRLKNNVTLQTGQELHFYGKADGNILNGELCQFAGVEGDHIKIKKVVPAEIIAKPSYLVGVATQNITNGTFGYVTWFGKVNGVYTNTPLNNDDADWVAGDMLYFNNTTGQLTKTAPTAPERRIEVAAVVKIQTGSSESGVIIIRPTFSSKLADLEDVDGSNPDTTGDLVTWNNTTGVWERNSYNINDYVLTTTANTTYLKLDASNDPITGDLEINTTTSSGLKVLRTDTRDARITVGDTTKSWSMSSGWGVAGDFSIIEETVAGNRLVIKQGGNVGLSVTTPSYSLSMIGTTARTIGMERHTTTNTAGNSLTIQAGGSTSGATDKAGGTLTLKGGLSTGTGTSSIILQTATPAASTGTGNNSFVTRVTVDHTGANIDAGLIVNESGSSTGDFRVESDTEANMLVVDADANTDGSVYLGGTTNGLEIQKGGKLKALGTATWFDDLRIEPVARTTGTGAPTFEKWYDDSAGTSRGVFLYSFTDEAVIGNEKEVFFTIQMPHGKVPASAIHLHLHWVGDSTQTTQTPRWGLEYTWKEIGADFGDTTIIYATGNAAGDTGVTANRHYLTEFADLTPDTTQDGLSSIVICRLFRSSSNAEDTYTGNKCGLLYVDAHIEYNQLGSNDEFSV